jgi:hypothetical protein
MYSFRFLLEFAWKEREKHERQSGHEPGEDWSRNTDIQASNISGLVWGIRSDVSVSVFTSLLVAGDPGGLGTLMYVVIVETSRSLRVRDPYYLVAVETWRNVYMYIIFSDVRC